MVHHGRDRDGDEDEDDERERLLGLVDRQRAERRREEPVEQQAPDHGIDDSGPSTADQRDPDRQREEQQQIAGERDVVAEGHEDEDEDDRPEDAQHPAGDDAPAGRAPVGGSDSTPLAANECVTMCTSMSPEPRTTRSPTPEPNSRRHPRCLLTPTTSCVALTPWAVASSASAMSVPTTVRKEPPKDSTRTRCALSTFGSAADQSVVRHDVHGEQLAAGGLTRDPGTATDQGVALRPSRQGDDDPLAGRPGRP